MKTPNRIVVVAMLVITCLTTAIAQPGGPKRENFKQQKEKIKAMKIAYITEKLDLTPEESQKFWPVYNKYEAKMKAIHEERRGNHNPDEALTEERANELIKLDIEMREKELTIHKAYLAELKTVIPATKIIKLHKAERDFKRVLLKKMKESRGRKDGPPSHEGPMGH